MIHAWGKQQTIFTIEPLFVRGISPGFAVTGAEVLFPCHTRDPAGSLYSHDMPLKGALASARQHQRLAVCFGQAGVGLDPLKLVLFPFNKPHRRADYFGSVCDTEAFHQIMGFSTQQIDQGRRQTLRKARQVRALQPHSVGPQRGVSLR